ncbi:hypothetical protein Hanom_Chr10g00926961 [Helianthus anomalus]
MAKILELDRYTRNPTQMGRVYSVPDGYWAGYGISLNKFRGFALGMGLGDTQPDYPKPYTLLPELYTRSCTQFF